MLSSITFTSLFPNPAQPFHAVFVRERLRHLIASGRYQTTVMAPVPWFPFKSAGFGRYAQYARAPRASEASGVVVEHPRFLTIPKVGMHMAPRLMRWGVKKRFFDLLAKKPDVQFIESHYAYPDAVVGAELAHQAGLPHVMFVRGSDINVIAGFAKPRSSILRAIDNSAVVVAVSDALKQALLRLGVAEEKVVVLRNGVDQNLFTAKRALEQAKLKEKYGDYLLCVGRLDGAKGQGSIIRALPQLPQFRLLLVGDGPERHSLVSKATRHQAGGRVIFLGQVEAEKLAPLYSAARCTLLLSEREGMPNVLLESLSCGTPVVATPVGGVAEVICEPMFGRLVDDPTPEAVAAAVQHVIAHATDSKKIAAKAAERFSWHNTIEKQLALYQEVVERKKSKGMK